MEKNYVQLTQFIPFSVKQVSNFALVKRQMKSLYINQFGGLHDGFNDLQDVPHVSFASDIMDSILGSGL